MHEAVPDDYQREHDFTFGGQGGTNMMEVEAAEGGRRRSLHERHRGVSKMILHGTLMDPPFGRQWGAKDISTCLNNVDVYMICAQSQTWQSGHGFIFERNPRDGKAGMIYIFEPQPWRWQSGRDVAFERSPGGGRCGRE